VGPGPVELVPGISPCPAREQGHDSQEVQNLIRSVRLPIRREVGAGRVLSEKVRDPPLGRLVELLEGVAGAYPVPVRGGLRPAPQGPRGRGVNRGPSSAEPSAGIQHGITQYVTP